MKKEKNLLDDLDENQAQVATSFPGPLCVMAGAGTGKTRAITYRIAYAVQQGIYDPKNVLALTFTNKAAFEMKQRLIALGVENVQARTFHSAALRQLSHFWSEQMGYELPRIVENKTQIISIVANKMNLKLDKASIRDISAEIEWAKVSVIPSKNYAEIVSSLDRQIPYTKNPVVMQSIFECYEQVKTDMGVIDFEDVLILLIGLFKMYPYILEEVQKQYKYFIVDEYQDVSLLQQLLLDYWVKNPKNLCVVGDSAQTIYSFAGAAPSFLLNFTAKYPDAKRIVLNKNYRSGKQIISLANKVISDAKYNGRKLYSVNLLPTKQSNNEVIFNTYCDEISEAENTVNTIKNLLSKGINSADIAVLYRTNAQSQYYENFLSENNIKYVIKNGTKFFSRPEIREATSKIKKIAISSPKEDSVLAVGNILSLLGWSIDNQNLIGNSKEKWDNLNALYNLAVHEKNNYPTVGQFYNYISDRIQNQHDLEIEGIVLSSLHSCKGLEWDYVFLTGMQEGFMPIALAKTDEQIEEEHRLLYVGITRAKEKLYISCSKPRKNASKNLLKTRSKDNTNDFITRFLTKYWVEQLHTISTKPLEKSNDQENILDEYGEDTAYLIELLKKWRETVANEENIPPYKLIKDSVIISIAIAKPKNLKQLQILRGVTKKFVYIYGKEIIRIVIDNI